MRPVRDGALVSVKLMGGAAAAGGGGPPSLWRTPTPYIFLALAFMMGVIALSLLVLICMRKKSSSSSSSRHGGAHDDDDEKAAARAIVPLDREPKVVVFMPGDGRAPSFLASAKPLVALAGDGGAAAGAAAAAAV